MKQVVIATAGHVDHGKSTLVSALTGQDPDRWAEEKQRGLTIDLGYVWTHIGDTTVSFVDVPGHERFLSNTLAGIGPAPIVLFIIAADDGWMPQSTDHRDAIAALGISHGLIVVTRADLAPNRVDSVLEEARRELEPTGITQTVAVSAVTGQGMEELRAQIAALVRKVSESKGARVATDAPLRMWVDRSFSIKGAGTVVTGTLGQRCLVVGETVDVMGPGVDGNTIVQHARIKGLQSHDQSVDRLEPVTRAALNLRGIPSNAISRGDVLVERATDWKLTSQIDVRRTTGASFDSLPEQVTVHVGTASVSAHARLFDEDHVRLSLARALPFLIGDRLVLRTSGEHAVAGGAIVLDVDPPRLTQRGARRQRAGELTQMSTGGSLEHEVTRRGAMARSELDAMGVMGQQTGAVLPIAGGEIMVHRPAWQRWERLLTHRVKERSQDPLDPGLSLAEAGHAFGVEALFASAPHTAQAALQKKLVEALITSAGFCLAGGKVKDPHQARSLGRAEAAVKDLENRWKKEPFAAPEARELERLRLSSRDLAAAEAQGRLLRLGGRDARGGAGARGGSAALGDAIILGPAAPKLAARRLSELPQPFTTAEAKRALETTRRIVIPLLEHLDASGATERLDDGHRRMR